MAYLFPIGTISGASSSGVIDGISYSLFEPNNGCISVPNYSNLVHEFENKTLFTRQKALSYLSILYSYEDIWTKEYNQLRSFVNLVKDSLTSFMAVDWSKGQDPSAISGADWSTSNVVSIDDTSLYSSITHYKSNNMLIWDGGDAWKLGTVISVSANTSVTINVTGNNYGSLSFSTATSLGYVYPVYTCYMTQGALSNFSKGEYVKQPIGLNEIGGFMYSGTISLRGKYKI